MDISTLKTPALLIDLTKLKENANWMLNKAKQHNVKLRPHVKTHKAVEIARIQHGGEIGPITVSTLAEAHFFAKAGFKDITYAVPIAASKLEDAFSLIQTGVQLNLLVDGMDIAKSVESFFRSHRLIASVFLKVDCGYHRAGVDPNLQISVELAQFLANSPHLEFLGLLTHAGHSYSAKSIDDVKKVARQERDVLVAFKDKLSKVGVLCKEISIGSTPTCIHAEDWNGVTEIRPGNYIFFDKFQADIGSCRLENCPAVVLATVISYYPERNQILIDAGALALSKDTGATHLENKNCFGAILAHPELQLVGLSQEHGIIQILAGKKTDVKVGSLLKIVPNHSCLTAALFPLYHVVENNKVIAEWVPARGW